MKETDFIKINKNKWERFEKLAKSKDNDPDEVSELFTEITEDLSYARTFYPRRSVRVYLNQLAQGVFNSLYKEKKQPIGNFLTFWKKTVPLEMYRARFNLLTSFIFFSLAVIIGAVSQHYDAEFIEIILGKDYVAATESRIADGNPMGIYGESPSSSMFFEITVNNVRVAFIAFTLGIFWTLGSFIILLKNGIMLGAFQWWFKAKGLLLTTFLAIWIHGAFEISAIVIAGAAGITVGNGLLFPRSYTRIQSVIFSARRGMVIMLSLIPFFILAGFLESFITRYYQIMPNWSKGVIIGGSFLVIILYYVIYPFKVAKKFPEKLPLEEIPRFLPNRKIEWFKIRKAGEVFTDTFTLLVAKIGAISVLLFRTVFPLALGMLTVVFFMDFERFDYVLSWSEVFGTVFGTHTDFAFYKLFGWAFPLAVLIGIPFYVMHTEKEDPHVLDFVRFIAKPLLWLYLYALLLLIILLFSTGTVLLFMLLITPILLMIPGKIIYEKLNFFRAFITAFNLKNGGYKDGLMVFVSLLLIIGLFFFILVNPLEMGFIFLINDLLKDMLITVVDNYSIVIALVDSVIYLLFIFFAVVLCMISFSLTYHSIHEKQTAEGLYKKLENFGLRNRNFESDVDFE